jgi:1,4-alpha-glucan branching enzyme
MLYNDHGLGVAFDGYDKYFSMNTDVEAVTYLQFANELIKEVNPKSITIAEDMSGMPGMCIPVEDGGIGFDYRLSMGVPDYWINTLSKMKDEDWNLDHMWHELTTRRPQEKNIGYCESHDQALVGDKTIMFWLADKEMYWSMDRDNKNPVIARAMDYHKIIRLVTSTLAGEGYLNFMGNEFGHPEWIDFPRAGNGESHKYARRQWSLVDNKDLKYQFLQNFDNAMLKLLNDYPIFGSKPELIKIHNDDKIMVYEKGGLYFLFNFHTWVTREFDLPLKNTAFEVVLDSDLPEFDGKSKPKKITKSTKKISLNPRTAVVLKAVK